MQNIFKYVKRLLVFIYFLIIYYLYNFTTIVDYE